MRNTINNNRGFTLVEVIVSMTILVGSIFTLSFVYIERKKDEVQVNYFSQYQSVRQMVLSRYSAAPEDFPIATTDAHATNYLHYVACLTPDGRTLIDFVTKIYSSGSVPTSAVECTNSAFNGGVSMAANAFEVHMIPSAWDAWFTVQIFPVTPPTAQQLGSFMMPGPFQVSYESGISTNFFAN